jgi:hypothetical protein
MVLRWSDDPDDSVAEVGLTMRIEKERKVFGRPWLAYCDRMGFKDDLFRIVGIERVETIINHEWNEAGKPVAEVEWKHGDVTKMVVLSLMESKTDLNKMKEKWEQYCDRIGCDDVGFRRGHVDRTKRLFAEDGGKRDGKKRRTRY